MSDMVHVRVDTALKKQATETFAAMGLSVSDAIRVFLIKSVTEQQLPFALKVPNSKTQAAMKEADLLAKAHSVRFATAEELFDDIEKNSKR